MKVVLFCGGFGTRLKEYSETIPKPMVEIGYRPVLWHIMRYYAHFGHKDFILCLGYRGDLIKNYFINYNEWLSNDFQLSKGCKQINLHNSDIKDWNITFADTGLNANIGQRLMQVRKYLGNDEMFLANYADGLSDLDLNCYLDNFVQSGKVASFLCVQPSSSFHVVTMDQAGEVQMIAPASKSNLWINGGFFAFRKELFDNITYGDELVQEPFSRLIKKNQLLGQQHRGFWACMDTLKEKLLFDEMNARGDRPWALWETPYQPEKVNDLSPVYSGSVAGLSMLDELTTSINS
jgi:glucose-1-phosphate cytidylyltransferase